MTTGAVSEKWVDLRYVSEESLTVIDGLNMRLKEKEKSRRNLISVLMTWMGYHLLRWAKLGMLIGLFLIGKAMAKGKKLVGLWFD